MAFCHSHLASDGFGPPVCVPFVGHQLPLSRSSIEIAKPFTENSHWSSLNLITSLLLFSQCEILEIGWW